MPDAPRIGTEFAGYRIDSLIGRGGMSIVYRAENPRLGNMVALKLLSSELANDETFRERFVRESRAAAELEHPNIVPVYDAGEVEGRLYLAMKFVEGTDLAHVLDAEGKLSADRTVPLLEQLASALDAAHEHGLIHRDVKPANALLDAERLYLTDFGLTRRVDSTRPLTGTGKAVGTAAYLAPEQVRGEEATPATDVYALGVVLYQFLTGRLPYEGSSLAELAVRQQNEKPLPPDTYNSEVPETLGAAVLRALEGDPGRRYASADELAAGLRLGLEGGDVTLPLEEGTSATRVLGGDTAATRHMGRDTAQTEYRPAQSQTRRPQPRVAPAPAPAAAAPRAAEPRRRGAFSRFVRFILAAVALVLVAAVVATAVIVTTDKAAGVKVSRVAGDTVDKVVEEVKDLVRENTE